MLPLLALIAVTSGDYDPPPFAVLVDRTRREVVLRIGPSHVPSAPPGMDHHTAYSAGGHNVPILQFAWPVSGWIRGYRLGITDAEGRSYTSRFLHHLNLLHLDRALLFDPVFERTIAIGQETADVRLPSSVGIRVDEGSRMGVHIAFANETGEDRHGVVLELRISYIGEDVVPRPTDIRPIVFDIGFRAGYGSAFDLPAGRSVHERVFTLPMDGRLLGAGGHLHQYAESLTLEDVETGKRLVTLRGIPDSAGLAGVTRKVLGVTGDGLRLKAGRTYTVRTFDPTGRSPFT